jgi:hypothetical protein
MVVIGFRRTNGVDAGIITAGMYEPPESDADSGKCIAGWGITPRLDINN